MFVLNSLIDFQDESFPALPLDYFGIFLITNLDYFQHSVGADKGWLVLTHRMSFQWQPAGDAVAVFVSGLPSLSLSLSPSPLCLNSIDWQMQMQGTAQQNINVDFTGGEVALASQPRVQHWTSGSQKAPAAAQGPGATPCQNNLPPATSPRESNVISQTEKWEQRGRG